MSKELERAESQAPAKTDEGPKRFVEKGPHVIYDTQTGLFWLKKDSWQDKGKFFNWHEARDYADNKNMRKIGQKCGQVCPKCGEVCQRCGHVGQKYGQACQKCREVGQKC